MVFDLTLRVTVVLVALLGAGVEVRAQDPPCLSPEKNLRQLLDPLEETKLNMEFQSTLHGGGKAIFEFGESIRIETLAAIQRRDPRILIREQLGFRYSTKPWLKVEHPTLREFVTRLNRLLKRSAGKDGLPMKPGRIFKKPDGTWFFTDYLAASPKGMTEFLDDVVPDELLIEMASQGFYPLSLERIQHDMEHFITQIQHPSYARALQKFLSDLHARQTKIELGGDTYKRYGFILEALDLATGVSRTELQSSLSPIFRAKSLEGHATVSEVYTQYLNPPKSLDVYTHAKEVLDLAQKSVSIFGAANREFGVYYKNGYLRSSLYRTMVDLKASIKGGAATSATSFHLARLEVGLWETSRLKPETVIEEFMGEKLSPQSPVYHYFCRSGFFENITQLGPGAVNAPLDMKLVLCP